jgi:type IX secretion system substrate protein
LAGGLLELQECAIQQRNQEYNKEETDAKHNRFTIFPNPSTGPCTIDYHLVEGSTASFLVTDIFGRQVVYLSVTPETSNRLTLPDLSVGVYIVSFIADGATIQSAKLIQY